MLYSSYSPYYCTTGASTLPFFSMLISQSPRRLVPSRSSLLRLFLVGASVRSSPFNTFYCRKCDIPDTLPVERMGIYEGRACKALTGRFQRPGPFYPPNERLAELNDTTLAMMPDDPNNPVQVSLEPTPSRRKSARFHNAPLTPKPFSLVRQK